MISLDTETTGLDLRHGAKPFLVTTCDESMEQTCWEWDVDPITREPEIPGRDLREIRAELNISNQFKLAPKIRVLQNTKFDVKALNCIGEFDWDWDSTYDTLLAGHLLASNEPHDLTSMALKYLGIDLDAHENRLKKAVKEARNICRTHLKDWRIAKKGLPEMPSAKETVWKNDLWLPRAIWRLEPNLLPEAASEYPWATLCREYANSDSAATLLLFKRQKELLQERGLWKIYLWKLKILPIIYDMEDVGVTLNAERMEKLQREYLSESWGAGDKCIRIAATFGYDLHLPKSGNNNSLLEFCFEKLKLPVVSKSPLTGKPSLNKQAMDTYKATLKEDGIQLNFINNLSDKRKRDTAINYIEGYRRFWICEQEYGFEFRLHPSLNPTGTVLLRFSSSNPNEQNISKKEGFNLRYAFGPTPGREWWSFDYNNLELRIPAFECGEQSMIDIFEKPDEPPYFGSYHLLVFSILHPNKWDHDDPDGLLKAKSKHAPWYDKIKAGNYSIQYGAVEVSGTADRAYGVLGAQAIVQKRFGKIAELNEFQIEKANRLGYVETIPDKTVDPEKGYPLLCARTKWGGVKPTIPLSAHVQGTAGWVMLVAMTLVDHILTSDEHLIMNIHDELVFDFPSNRYNIYKAREIKKLMESVGDRIGIPLTCGMECHPNNWSESA